MDKELHYIYRGKEYKVNRQGALTQAGNKSFSYNWHFLGVSFHHWRNGIDVTLDQAFEDPKSIIKGLIWDRDHGTLRRSGGSYFGRLPRITSAWLE